MISKKFVIAVLCVVAMLALTTVLYKNIHVYSEYDITPTCETGGGHYRICRMCGKTECIYETEPTGHIADWKETAQANAVNSGVRELRCTFCNKLLEAEFIHVKTYSEPTVHLYGGGYMNYEIYDDVKFTYSDENEISALLQEDIEASAYDADIRLYDDNEIPRGKYSYLIEGFSKDDTPSGVTVGISSSDVLYLFANNDDPTMSRRTVHLRQWRDIVSEYPVYYDLITSADKNVFDAKNILLYIRSSRPTYSYAGIYTALPRYDAFLKGSSKIKYVIAYDEVSEEKYSYVFGDADLRDTAVDSLQNLLTDSSSASRYSSTDILTDYISYAEITSHTEAFSKLYWVSADGVRWYPMPYISQHIFGVTPRGTELSEPMSETTYPEGFWNDFYYKNKRNIDDRISELVSGRLSPKNVRNDFHGCVAEIEDTLYKDDCTVSGAQFTEPNALLDEISVWYENRLKQFN